MAEAAAPEKGLTAQDFHSKLMVRWCPGCGDYSILAAVQQTLAKRGKEPHEYAFISGIGCSSRFPHYMSTYGFHTIHGRAPGFATGFKCVRPEIDTWIISGDGDGFSIGGNHMIHLLRRNVDVNMLLFNNEIYGLTKGQYSPTSASGLINKSAPLGVIDNPLNPCEMAIAAGATFVARTADNDPNHMKEVLEMAADHKGISFVEILQNCVIFHDKVHEPYYGVKTRKDAMVYLHNGEPMLFGKTVETGLFLDGLKLKTDPIKGNSDKAMKHDTSSKEQAQLLVGLKYPNYPVPMGVLYQIQKPTYNDMLHAQVNNLKEKKGEGDLQKLLRGGKTWTVKAA